MLIRDQDPISSPPQNTQGRPQSFLTSLERNLSPSIQLHLADLILGPHIKY